MGPPGRAGTLGDIGVPGYPVSFILQLNYRLTFS